MIMKSTPVNFFERTNGNNTFTKGKKDRQQRLAIRKNLTAEQRQLMLKYDKEYFESEIGYGGYNYDGRYGPAVERMIQYYGLKPGNRMLDIGCAKGFLVYEFQKRLGDDNQSVAFGCDISSFALDNCKEEVRSQLFQMSADKLDFQDNTFDLVISIDTIHNLPENLADNAIREMIRVSKGSCFLQVASYSSPETKEALRNWAVTIETFRNPKQWLKSFEKNSYTGEYNFKIFRFDEEK